MAPTFALFRGTLEIHWSEVPALEEPDEDLCHCDRPCDCEESDAMQPDGATLKLHLDDDTFQRWETDSLLQALVELAALGRPEVTSAKEGRTGQILTLRWQRPDPEPT